METTIKMAGAQETTATVAKTKSVYPHLCPRCGRSLPRSNKQERHNFIATMDKDGEVEIICISCRMQDFQKHSK